MRKTSVTAVGICGVLVVGYCIYCDRKRQSDPNFTKRLPKRRKQRLAMKGKELPRTLKPHNEEAMQAVFLEEIQCGEESLVQGDDQPGVDHLSKAVVICGQPRQFFQVLRKIIPPPIFHLLLKKLSSLSL